MSSVSDLYAKIGFKVDDTGLKDFGKELVNLKNTIAECLSGLDGFAQAAEKIAKAAKAIKASYSGDTEAKKKRDSIKEATQKLKEKQLEIAAKRVEIAQQREQRLQQSAKDKKNREGLTSSISTGGFSAWLNATVYNGIKNLFSRIGNFIKGLWSKAWNAIFTYRDYRRYTNLQDAELNRWTAMAAGYATRPEIAQNMMEVQQGLLGIRLGQGNILAARLAGVSADTTDPYEYLNRFRKAFIAGNVSPEWQKYILNLAGFGDWAVGAIQNSKNEKEWEESLKRHIVETDKQVEIAKKFREIESLLIDAMSKVLETIGDTGFQNAINWLTKLIVDIVDLVRSGYFKGKGLFKSLWNLGDFISASKEERQRIINGINEDSDWGGIKGFFQWRTVDGGNRQITNNTTNNITAANANDAMYIYRNIASNTDVENETYALPDTQNDVQQSYIGGNQTTASMYNSFKRLEQSEENARQRFNERKNAAIEAAVARGMTRERAEQIASEWNL